MDQYKIIIFLPLDGPPINITAFNMIEFLILHSRYVSGSYLSSIYKLHQQSIYK